MRIKAPFERKKGFIKVLKFDGDPIWFNPVKQGITMKNLTNRIKKLLDLDTTEEAYKILNISEGTANHLNSGRSGPSITNQTINLIKFIEATPKSKRLKILKSPLSPEE